MLVYSKSLGEKTGNLAVNQYQFGMLSMERNAALNHQGVNVMQEIADRLNAVNHLNGINAVRSPADLYKAFDQTVLRQFQPNTEFTLFNDLMPLSRSVRINQTVYEYRQVWRPHVGSYLHVRPDRRCAGCCAVPVRRYYGSGARYRLQVPLA